MTPVEHTKSEGHQILNKCSHSTTGDSMSAHAGSSVHKMNDTCFCPGIKIGQSQRNPSNVNIQALSPTILPQQDQRIRHGSQCAVSVNQVTLLMRTTSSPTDKIIHTKVSRRHSRSRNYEKPM